MIRGKIDPEPTVIVNVAEVGPKGDPGEVSLKQLNEVKDRVETLESDRFVLENKFVDPLFSNGIDKWNRSTGTTLKNVSDGTLEIEITTTYGQLGQRIKPTAGHIYYTNWEVKIQDFKTFDLRTYRVVGSSAGGEVVTGLKETTEWQTASGIFVPKQEFLTSESNVMFKSTVAGLKTAQIKRPILLDLTDIFGAGNEPSTQQMDQLRDMLSDNFVVGEYELTNRDITNWFLGFMQTLNETNTAVTALGGTIL